MGFTYCRGETAVFKPPKGRCPGSSNVGVGRHDRNLGRFRLIEGDRQTEGIAKLKGVALAKARVRPVQRSLEGQSYGVSSGGVNYGERDTEKENDVAHLCSGRGRSNNRASRPTLDPAQPTQPLQPD